MRRVAATAVPVFRTQTQADLLAAIYLRRERHWTLASLSRELNASPSTLHAEVKRLEEAELINATEVGRSRILEPNLKHPISKPLIEILSYMYGPQVVIAEEFANIPGADRVLVFGSWAARHSGEPGHAPHDIDVLVIGDADRTAVYAAADRAQDRIGIPVNPVLASTRRWQTATDALIRQIKASPTIELISRATDGGREAGQ
ncbi:hypothetical protein ACFHYQ_21540 [Sphaerimonospora cavernae]|uniref:MarR family protein n=1 Tax=Sphaerimonospora cavernae TaxID=1740611 RepID=A0ABV6U9N7_9ACTN